MNDTHYQFAPGAQPAPYQLPGRINIQAAPLPAYPLYYLGLPVPQFATLTQANTWTNHPILHPSFGPHPLPDDHPSVPYPAEPGMQWLGYIAPSPGRHIPIDNPAHYINPYDINGPRGFPPHIPPAHGLQNSLLNTSHGLIGAPIANPMANLAVIGYYDENHLVALENQRILGQICVSHPTETMNEFCEDTRRELESLRPDLEIERATGASLSNFAPSSFDNSSTGSGGMSAGEDIDGRDDENTDIGVSDEEILSDSDMDYEG
ncbi:hypothetical protein BofuT4_P008550.1 [Botrytis cinerea T4]|uniref:Uncharacterized protein n=1 Tax=Botryotinia fuckeliana (strain T4) TaxID=999810 RepID=G2XX60_BOTF4|nr:hypothetical protein BofuT4_P008550.1 [Botrytis cinerea T4]